MMKHGLAWAVCAALAMTGVGIATPVAQADEVNVIPDAGLRLCLAYEMNDFGVGYRPGSSEYASEPDSISQVDLDSLARATKRLYSLSCPGVGSLSGLENLHDSDLNALLIYNSVISDVTPLKNLTSLTYLDLSDNQISDLTPLTNLTNLTYLDLSDNQISDLTPLKNLTNLTGLDLSDNQISDLTPLTNLTNLTRLDLSDNQISDLAPLVNLTNLIGSELSDRYLTGLDLSDNQISDLTPLKNLTNLKRLDLPGNQISDLTPLTNLTNLTSLDFSDNQISDLTPLVNLTNLTGLDFSDNQISDTSPLTNLTNLETLTLDDNQISDLTPLANLTNLGGLDLSDNQISDLTPLKNLMLWGLRIADNQISDVSALKDMTHLEGLSLGGNHIKDLSPLDNVITHVASQDWEWDWYALGQTVRSSAKSGLAVSLPSVVGLSLDNPVSWKVVKGDASIDASKGTITYKSPGEVVLAWQGRRDYFFSGTVTVSTCQNFTDVPDTNTFAPAICWVSSTGITKGTGNGSTYSPTNPVNRGSMAAFLYRLAGSPKWDPPKASPFVDVKTTDTFYPAITWLYSQGITVGTTVNGKVYYQPTNAVNRGSMSAFLYRFSASPKWTLPITSPFDDVNQTNTFYKSITWLADQKITVGSTSSGKVVYQPGNPVNRGSMAAFMQRLAKTGLQCTKYSTAVGC